MFMHFSFHYNLNPYQNCIKNKIDYGVLLCYSRPILLVYNLLKDDEMCTDGFCFVMR